jgi:uncharacterized cupredoxin-like copper-binding protein
MMRSRLSFAILIGLLIGTSLTACTSIRSQVTPTSTPAVQTITVTLTDTAITASQTTVRPGVRYHFVVTNRGKMPHQFWLMPQGMSQMMSQMPMSQWHSKVLASTPDIGPGMMASLDYTYTMPMMQQALAYGCYTASSQALVEMPMQVRR